MMVLGCVMGAVTFSASGQAEQRVELEGSLAQDELFEIYEYEVQNGQQIVVDLTSEQFDTYVSVQSPSGQYLSNDDWNNEFNHSHVQTTANETGTWRVRVAGFSTAHFGDYVLQVYIGNDAPLPPGGGPAPIMHNGELRDGDETVPDSNGRIVDHYTFEVVAGQQVEIDLTSNALDTLLMLQSPSGVNWENDDFEGQLGHSRLAMMLTEPGEYTASATTFQPGEMGAYQLVIQLAAAPDEPLDIEQQTHQGRLAPGDERLADGEFADKYPIAGERGDQYTITLDSDDFDTYLVLVQDGVEDGLHAQNDDFQGSLTRSRISQTLPADGDYTLYVTSFNGGETGSYDLTIERIRTESEGQEQRGTLAIGDEQTDEDKLIDWSEVTIGAGQHIEVTVESRDFDTFLIIESPEGERWVNDDYEGRTDMSMVEFDAAQIGIYRIGVTSYQPQETGDYEVNIRLRTTNDPTGMRISQPLAQGEPRTGELADGDASMDYGQHADRYHFDAQVGQRIVIDLKSDDFDTFLRLLSPDGSITDNDDYDGIEHSQLAFNVQQTGRYRLIVSSFKADEAGDYELSMRLTDRNADDPAPASRVLGLFVGISDYNGAGDLPYTAEDADRMFHHYRDYGMRPEDATLLLDDKATVEAIEAGLSRLAEQATDQDTVIIFYSGHGNQVARESGFSASDPDAKDETIAVYDGEISDDRFAELLEPCQANTMLLMMDSCFSGGFAKDVICRPGRIGLFSSEEDVLSMVADEFQAGGYLSEFVHEAYGERRDDADANNDKALTVHELCYYVARRYNEVLEERKPEGDNIEGTEVDPSVNIGYQRLLVDRGGVSPHRVLASWD